MQLSLKDRKGLKKCPNCNLKVLFTRQSCMCGHSFHKDETKTTIEGLEASAKQKQSNKQCMALVRISKAPQVSKRKNAKVVACKRSTKNLTITINEAISNFLAKVKIGPDFVCTVCNRSMYSTNVVSFDISKYKIETLVDNIFSFRYLSFNDKEWICLTCNRSLKKGKVPVMAKANGLQLQTIATS